ncbi:MAG: YfbU family protein, partial [Anaerolineae bacterium]|nr:YfbU family protein [Anaerolineae bacterium]
MTRFFFSYSHSDRPFLDDLLPQMQTMYTDGTLWFDDALTGGAEWWTKILNEIDKCDIFIFLLSDESTTSQYCREELRHAIQFDKRILPVIVRRLKKDYPSEIDADLSDHLKTIQYVDLQRGLRDTPSVTKLWSAIRSLEHPTIDPKELDKEGRTKLSRNERWLLSNQFQILALLDPEQKDSYDQMRTVVESGYELHYDWITSYIYDGNSIMSSEE